MRTFRLLFALSILALISLALFMNSWLRPRLTWMPEGFRYEADIFSRDNLFDADKGEYREEMVSEGRFAMECIQAMADGLRVRNTFVVRTTVGDTLFSAARIYGLDRRTWTHRRGLGDRDRTGFLFGPMGGAIGDFPYWHANYDTAISMRFQGTEDISGLKTHRFAGRLRADQSADLARLPSVPETRGIVIEGEIRLWVEPQSGWLVKYEDEATTWYYDRSTGNRLHPWNRFKNSFTQASVEEQVQLAGKARIRFLWAGPFSGGLLLLASAALSLGLIRPWQRPQKRAPLGVSPATAWWGEASALLIGALGLGVMVGWGLRLPSLVQVLPGSTPMMFNTGLGFLLAGIGLWGAFAGRTRLRRSAACALSALGSVILIQYLADIDLGLDNLIVDYRGFGEFRFGAMEFPGRMSQVTAICFLMSGAALLPDPCERGNTLVGVLASLILALGGLAVVGYVLGFPQAYRIGPMAEVAFHTSVGFLLLGCALLPLACTQWSSAQGSRRIIAFSWAGGIGFLALLYLALVERERRMVEAEGLREAHRVTERISEMLEDRAKALRRMSARWTASGGTPKDIWEMDAEGYVRDYPGIQAVSWVDASHRVRWIHPLAGNEAALGLDLSQSASRQAVLDAARRSGEPTVSPPIQLAQGGRGFLVVMPLGQDGSRGFISGVFRFDRLMNLLIEESAAEGHGISLLEGEDVLYSYRQASRDPGRRKHVHEAPFLFAGRPWKLVMVPRQELRDRTQSILPETIFASGFIVLALGTLSISLSWRSARQTGLLQRERELAMKRESQFRQFLESAPDAVVVVDSRGRILLVNAQTERMFGYSRTELTGELVELLIPERYRPSHPAHRDQYFAEPRTRAMGAGHELTARRKDGTEFPVEISLSPLSGEEGTMAMSLIRDVTDQRRTQRALADQAELLKLQKAEAIGLADSAETARLAAEAAERRTSESLGEKEILLKEVHHRVKNNLQIISTLLRLQSNKMVDPEAMAALRDSEDRVQSMALLHENLYQAGDLAQVDFGAYLESLTTELMSSHNGTGGKIRLDMAADIGGMDLEKAVPLGLLVNELMVNALKHAFPDGRAGTISVRLHPLPGGGARLSVKDDGIGLPEGAEEDSGSSLGLQIISTLSRQLRGTYAFLREGGTEFRLDFPLEEDT